MTTRQRIVKVDGSQPTEVEKEVDRCLADIESSAQSELRAEVAELTICAVKPVEVPASGKTALVIFVPYRVYMNVVKRIHARLVQELEKKLKRHVVIIAQRSIVGLDYKRKNLKVRPRSRTLTNVQDAMLEDIVAPSEVVGRRWRVRADGSKLMKVHLDPKDKAKDNLEEKLWTFAAVYKRLTNKDAAFLFPEHVY
ncbi:40S ribosomal protein S7, putative [Eimeria necatrix]|uniref:40S ribosomal protein S7 n=2 Tax=Eimeria TaxID=5800 RepID=U6MJN4_9EIME|nr:40S ribosomal protein S7, putative [Eimeria tenella]XP_013432914.1 40S ribosomal protein S7, putative [Eimeria necatrix]CDJ37234.1 40S ribosomal protein S7, putative [Eimeria tenella]CDJ64447.1 40S ribosomal protein S7, putative [Eimeria necatrix]|eukprot:XP_013228072.1 40S ribosomal protein S7, putative [Eimeria tenella]